MAGARGLAFNEGKTRVVTLDEGFDFLGFNVRRYGRKPLIKPSRAAVRRIRERLRSDLDQWVVAVASGSDLAGGGVGDPGLIAENPANAGLSV